MQAISGGKRNIETEFFEDEYQEFICIFSTCFVALPVYYHTEGFKVCWESNSG